MTNDNGKLETYAIVEAMGHQRFAGMCREVAMGGCGRIHATVIEGAVWLEMSRDHFIKMVRDAAGKLGVSCDQRDAEYHAAPAIDLLNTWMREYGLHDRQCVGINDMQRAIGDLWDRVSAKIRSREVSDDIYVKITPAQHAQNLELLAAARAVCEMYGWCDHRVPQAKRLIEAVRACDGTQSC